MNNNNKIINILATSVALTNRVVVCMHTNYKCGQRQHASCWEKALLYPYVLLLCTVHVHVNTNRLYLPISFVIEYIIINYYYLLLFI